jgi:5-keto-L-gluconate epimerase
MKLALCLQTPEVPVTLPVALLSGSLDEKLAQAARLGADGVELMTVNPAALDAVTLRAQLQAHGLEAAAVASGGLAFGLGLTLLHADPAKAAEAARRLADLIDFAAAIGAPVVTVGSFRGRVAGAGPDGAEGLCAELTRQGAYAAERGVRLALEPLNRYEGDIIRTAAEGLDFVGRVGSPAVGLLLDTYHVNIEESSWTTPFSQVLAAGRLWHVHLGDNNRLPPGQGLIDFAAIVNTLRAGGYTGYLSAELLPRPDPDQAAQETLTYMRPLLAR